MTNIPFHLYDKVRKERDSLKGLVKWIKRELDEIHITVIGTHPMWLIDSESYDELANKIMVSIDDHLEEMDEGILVDGEKS